VYSQSVINTHLAEIPKSVPNIILLGLGWSQLKDAQVFRDKTFIFRTEGLDSLEGIIDFDMGQY
jgi:hypothetical protein